MDTQKALITIKSCIDGDETLFRYQGEYRLRNGSHCIVYTDYTGDSVTKVAIEANENAMLIHRVGGITADMLFDSQLLTAVNYEAMAVGSTFLLQTHEYGLLHRGNRIRIYVDYSLRTFKDDPGIHGKQEITVAIEGTAERG